MQKFLWFVFLLALVCSVSGRLSKASHLSNIREVTNICAESSITEVSCDGSDALGLLPHPDDCRLFYQCAHGVPFCHRCPPGLHFNPKLLVCDAPAEAGCVAGTEADEYDSPRDDAVSTEFGDEIPPRCVVNSVTRVSCAEATSDDALLAHPDDCELFYYCVAAAAAPVCRQCPANLHFNPTLHVCDDPERAGCRAGNAADPALMVLFA